jgi:hypothetical protein
MMLPPSAGPHRGCCCCTTTGRRFAIGKEKVLTPWDDPPLAAQAAAWQERLYDGVSLGEALRARGFAVIWAGQRLRGAAGARRQSDAVRPDSGGRHRRRGRVAGALAGAASSGGRAPGRGRRLFLRRLPRLAAGNALSRGGRPGGSELDGPAQRPDAVGWQSAARPVRLPCCIRRWVGVLTIPTSPGSRRRNRCCSCRAITTGTTRQKSPSPHSVWIGVEC